MARMAIFFFCFLLSSCSFSESPSSLSWEVQREASWSTYEKELSPEERLAGAKNRRKESDTLRKWDYFLSKNMPKEALPYYQSALERIGNDTVIQKKIARIYFLEKDFQNAYLSYVLVPLSELSPSEKKEMITALFAGSDIRKIPVEIEKIPLSDGEKQYYRILSHCMGGFDICAPLIRSASGISQEVKSLQINLKESELLSKDPLYQAFSLAVLFYEKWEFPLTEKFARDILKEKSDYMQVRKLLAFTLVKLAKYSEAKRALLSYLEAYPNDLEVIARLGEVYALMKDYATSSLYLNNAILAWYRPKTELERQLAYNYSALSDTENMTKVLSYLLQEEDVRETDFAVAISLALGRSDSLRALSWSEAGMKKFPDSRILPPLYITALRSLSRIDDALHTIGTFTPEIQSSPPIILEKWIILFQKWMYDEAEKLFERILSFGDDSDFANEANFYLEDIKKIQEGTGSNLPEKKGWWF